VLSDFLSKLYEKGENYGEDEKDVCEALLKLQYLLILFDCPPDSLSEEKIQSIALDALKKARQNCTKVAHSVVNFNGFVNDVMYYITGYPDCGYDEHKDEIVHALATLGFVNAKLRKPGRSFQREAYLKKMDNRWEMAIALRKM